MAAKKSNTVYPTSTYQPKSYKSLSRPGGSGSFSSFAQSAVKKNNSAEDAIIDKQYAEGAINAEAYKLQIQGRLQRTYLTPLQVVSLQDKLNKVDEQLVDEKVDTMAQSGELSTDQVLEYEKTKLGRIKEQDSVAYQNQAQKVQALTVKAQKEKRTQFRIQENLRISQMPEDTSERAMAKARAYEQLEAMARQDGDQQAADVFATSKINYAQSAKKAEINDLITNTRLSVSQSPAGGLGVPDANRGQQLYAGYTGSPGASVPSGGGSPTSTGNGAAGTGSIASFGSGSTFSPALKNSYEALDRSAKSIERLFASRQDKQALIQTYQEAVNAASGDQKTQLSIALNNLVSDVAGIDNQIDIAYSNVQDQVLRIQEKQAAAASSAFSQDVRRNNASFTKAENELETEFQKGRITKQEYIGLSDKLAQDKLGYLNQVSDGFAQFGNESSADSYMTKASDWEQVVENVRYRAENIDDFEAIHVDPGGRITNMYGKNVKPGEFVLEDVRKLKDDGRFDSNYFNFGGQHYKIYYPGIEPDADGYYTSDALEQQIARRNNKAFVYYNNNGKMGQQEIAFTKRKDPRTGEVKLKPMLLDDVWTTDIGEGGKQTQRRVKGLQTLTKEGLFQYNDKTKEYTPASTAPSYGLGTKAVLAAGQAVKNVDKFIQDNGGMPQFGEWKTTKDKFGKNQTIWYPFEGKNNKLGFLEEPKNVLTDVGQKLNELKPENVLGRQIDKVLGAAGEVPFVKNAIESGKKQANDIFTKVKDVFQPKGLPGSAPLDKNGRPMIQPKVAAKVATPINPTAPVLPGINAPVTSPVIRVGAKTIDASKFTSYNDFANAARSASPTINDAQLRSAYNAATVKNMPVTPQTQAAKQQIAKVVAPYKPAPVAAQSAQMTPQGGGNSGGGGGINLPSLNLPKINVPQLQLPKISVPQFKPPQVSIPKPVQNVANNIGKTVSNVVNNVKNFLGGLFK